MDIEIKNLSHVYNVGSPLAVQALTDVNLTLPSGSYTALIGHTGSGKSTLLQHLNVLLKPTSGQVCLGERSISAQSKDEDLKALRQKVGTVFQFPETQLFEEDLIKDVAFGPKNFGATEEEAEDIAREKLKLVGIKEAYFSSSPFELSGGQQRRVAIAGVLALNPEVLILDEPTAGLDPKGQYELMTLFKELHESGLTIILVTHQMEHVAEYADHVAVMEAGRVVRTGRPRDIFSDRDWLKEKQLDVPKVVDFAGQCPKGVFDQLPMNIDELADGIASYLL